jgi:hypothetical protein
MTVNNLHGTGFRIAGSPPSRVSQKSLRMLFQVGAELAKPNNVGRAI